MSHLAIGDFIYQGVWLQALKAKYPHLVIDIWFDDCRRKPHGWAAGRNVILSEWLTSTGAFDTLYPIVSDLGQRRAQIHSASGRDYDLIVFIGKNRSEQFAKVARQISGSAFVVAAKSKPLSNPIAKWWHFRGVDGQFSFDEYSAGCEHISRVYEMAFETVFGLTAEDTGGRKLVEIELGSEHSARAKEFIESIGRHGDKSACVFVNHLGTASRKHYPWHQLKEVILDLNERHDGLVFVVNSPPDRFDEIGRLIEGDEELKTLALKPFTATGSFFELPAVMSECDLVLTVDTATSHLAAALGKPQVTIMADGAKLWQPLGDGIVLEGSGKARSIAAAQIVESLDRLLAKIQSGIATA